MFCKAQGVLPTGLVHKVLPALLLCTALQAIMFYEEWIFTFTLTAHAERRVNSILNIAADAS